ncbi:unnamed protein product [Hydatigera taeniaeformis]|uniref:DUF5734 domain-containing protein n=1 Tax=Hydatigena taeniaeformis TaxID=6205 RepID=A0A0R3WTJ8_HYDTA|nr:unnamed protein product [Hydatigera taeniaeformis]
MEKPEFIISLLHLKCEKRKVKMLQKVMEKRLKGAIKSKPRNYTLQLYKDQIKFQDQKEAILFDNVREVRESEENLVLVLSSDCKEKAKCSLATMKFKTADDYAKVLCRLNGAMNARNCKNENGTQQEGKESGMEVLRKDATEQDPRSLPNLCLPRVNGNVRKYARNMRKTYSADRSSMEQVRMKVFGKPRWRQREHRIVPSVERRVVCTEDSDYSSSYSSHIDLFSELGCTDTETSSSYHYEKNRGNYAQCRLVVPKDNASKKFIRDSLGNPVRIIRPRVTQPRSMAY